MARLSACTWVPIACAVAGVLAIMTAQSGGADAAKPTTAAGGSSAASHNCDRCMKGNSSVAHRVYNGRYAALGQFPYMAHIYVTIGGIKHTCGGALVDEDWVLTAAHCIKGLGKIDSTEVAIGVTDLTDYTSSRQNIRVVQHVPNPRFRPAQVNSNFTDDIALLQLHTSADLRSTTVDTIKLPKKKDNTTSRNDGLLMGWGLADPAKEADTRFRRFLSYFSAGIVELSRCETYYDMNFDNKTLCVESLDHGAAACLGDTGGPFVVGDKVIGVLSHVPFCGQHTESSITNLHVVTQVAPYRPWINNYIQLDDQSTRQRTTRRP